MKQKYNNEDFVKVKVNQSSKKKEPKAANSLFLPSKSFLSSNGTRTNNR